MNILQSVSIKILKFHILTGSQIFNTTIIWMFKTFIKTSWNILYILKKKIKKYSTTYIYKIYLHEYDIKLYNNNDTLKISKNYDIKLLKILNLM